MYVFNVCMALQHDLDDWYPIVGLPHTRSFIIIGKANPKPNLF